MARLQTAMQNEGLDGMLLFAQESMFWLTGYDTFGYCFFQGMIVRADGRFALLTRSADLRQARLTSIINDIRVWKDGSDATPAIELCDLAKELGLAGKRLGVEYNTVGLTAWNGKAVDAAFEGVATLVDATALVPNLRTRKSDAELVHVRKASELGDDGFAAALDIIGPGADEGEILAALQGTIFAGGGDYAGNEFIIGSAEEALLCRYKSGRRKLDDNDQLTLEWAGAFARYHSAMMQTVVIGAISDHHKRLFDAASAALTGVETAMVIGNSFGDVFAAHADALDQLGLSQHRLNACGYNLGGSFTPCWMDFPMFYENNPAIIEQNMVLFAHMIIMDSDTNTAMTLGRTYITTDEGPERLSRFGHELMAR